MINQGQLIAMMERSLELQKQEVERYAAYVEEEVERMKRRLGVLRNIEYRMIADLDREKSRAEVIVPSSENPERISNQAAICEGRSSDHEKTHYQN